MAFTNKEGYVRVDIFKPSGKWYSTAAVDMSAGYNEANIHRALYDACVREFDKEGGEWGLSVSPQAELEEGFMFVCLEPYSKFAHPIMLTGVPREW